VNRAYSLLTIKSVDDDQRVITGIATTPTPDRDGDIVESAGAQFHLPIPLLWQHNSREPIGEVFAAKVTTEGIEIKARIAQIEDAGKLKDRLDEAWQSLKAGLVRGLSIGFKSIEDADIKGTYGIRFLKWLWLELSAVTIPANAEASIQTVKSLDVGLAATGRPARVARSSPAGVSAPSRTVKLRTERPMKKTLTDKIAAFAGEKTAKIAKMNEIAGADEGSTLDAAQQEEFDTLAGEIKAIDGELSRLETLEQFNKSQAKPVNGEDPEKAARSRAGQHVITVEKKLPAGIQFARYAMCVAASKGSRLEAMDLAKRHYPDDSAILSLIEKGAVGAANTQTAGNASELVYAGVMDDFIEYLRPKTIVGKFGTDGIPSLRRVPFNTRVSGISAGTTGYWVGEGLPVPMSKATTFATSLTWAKIEALAVLTKEEVRFSNPSAESKVRDDLAAAIIARMDIDFIDPGKAAVANVSPASITFNTPPIAPSGTTAAAMRTDIATLLGTFTTLLLDPSDIVLIMSAGRALNLSLMITTLGNQSFPGMTMMGGSLLGIPVITSQAMVALGSPDQDIIVAVKAGDIYLADDGVVTVDASDQASIEMLDSSLVQNGMTGTGASLVSLWQSGLLGLKANREVTWKLRRAGAARYIGPAAYAA